MTPTLPAYAEPCPWSEPVSRTTWAPAGGLVAAPDRDDAFGDHAASSRDRVRAPERSARLTILIAVVVVIAAVTGALGHQTRVTSFPSATSDSSASSVPATSAAVGEADGVVPDGVTVFDEEYPAVAGLDPGLLEALREAAEDAGRDGVELVVNSGWRSAAYQEQLLGEAVGEYGSEQEAARWVATPETSAHVSGDAVDIGPAAAAGWLARHGGEYGLCQVYRNEPWHFELRPGAADDGCPRPYADPTHDPRMQK